nr:hypothetical protein [Anaerolineales bacterium]
IPITVEIIELFKELDVPIKDRQALVNWLQAAQTPGGRFDTETRYNQMFAERHPVDEVGKDIQYHHPLITGTRSYSEVEETAHAVRALKLLGSEPGDKAATIKWLQDLQHPEGFFSGKRYPDYWQISEDGLDPATMSAEQLAEYTFSDQLTDTYWAVMALEDLATRPRDAETCRNWLKGAVAVTWALDKSKWVIAWEHLEALYLLGGRLPDEEKWIEEARHDKGISGIATAIYSGHRFEIDRLERSFIVPTMQSLRLLDVLGGLDEEFLAKVK